MERRHRMQDQIGWNLDGTHAARLAARLAARPVARPTDRSPVARGRRWSLRVLWLACLVCLAGVAGCGPDLEFHRPNIIARSPDSSFLVLNDAHEKRLLVLDRQFRLLREIRGGFIANVWGILVTDQEIIVCNHRTLGIGTNQQEKEALKVVEFLFFDHQGNLKKQFTWEGHNGPLKAAGTFIQEKDGTLVAVDSKQNCLVKITPDGQPGGFIATYGRDLGQLYYPNDILVTPEGKYLVVDEYNSRLQVLDRDGGSPQVVIGSGEDPGQVSYPQFMVYGPDGNLYVSELATMRVSVFDAQYRFLRAMSPPLENEKELVQLWGVCVLASPTQVVTVDNLGSRLFVFDGNGVHQETIGKCRP